MPSGSNTHKLTQLPGCAERFGEIEGHHSLLTQGIDDMKNTMEDARKERREDHKELVSKLDGFIVDHENRVTNVEASTKSAHHRVDTIKSILQWAGGILVTIGVAVAGFLATKGSP